MVPSNFSPPEVCFLTIPLLLYSSTAFLDYPNLNVSIIPPFTLLVLHKTQKKHLFYIQMIVSFFINITVLLLMYDKIELPVSCDLWRLTTNLFKWYTSCHQLDHISGLDDYKWIPGFLSGAHSHASLNNIKLAFQFLWGNKRKWCMVLYV